jgi:hypothetical protein
VELRGFEPLTPSMRTRCATGLRYSPGGPRPRRPRLPSDKPRPYTSAACAWRGRAGCLRGLVEHVFPRGWGRVGCMCRRLRLRCRLRLRRASSRSIRTALTPLVKRSFSCHAGRASFGQQSGRKEGDQRQPQDHRSEAWDEPGHPRSSRERPEGRETRDDQPPTSCGCALSDLGIVCDPRERAHRDPVPLDTAGLVVVVAAEPHGDEYGGPQGNDRHIDQTRHINER